MNINDIETLDRLLQITRAYALKMLGLYLDNL